MAKKLSEDQIKALIIPDLENLHSMELELSQLENALSLNPQFKQFIELQKAVNEKDKEIWDKVKETMLKYNSPPIENDWVRLTTYSVNTLEVDEKELPRKFTKRAPDTQAINDYLNATGKTIKGVKKVTSYRLRKTFRKNALVS